ncbi:MAG TPA: hypothetical protein VFC96_04225 [Anaerovoracaceae bacterium]|nr:hypothetical protein [Anaerovoracaceae bacterium]
MESYTALRRSSLKKDNSKFTLAVGAFIALFAIYKRDYLFVLIGAVLIYISLYAKDVIIDRNGVTVHYHAVFYNKTMTYPFTDYSELRIQRNLGQEIVIGFVRNGMNTNCLFTLSDGESVINLVKTYNPAIVVTEIIARKRPKF